MAIAGSHLVTDIFGYWPTFHDAEVTRLLLLRTAPSRGPMVELDVYTFEITADVGPDGTYVLRHHTLVSFQFEGAREVELQGFNSQNALMGLTIADIRSQQLEGIRYEVSFDGSFGVSGRLLCAEARVTSAYPLEMGKAD